jgi:autotransporter-associated beta strand protein
VRITGATVNLDLNRTVGRLEAGSLTLSSSNSSVLTFDGNGGNARLDLSSLNNTTISAGLDLATSLDVFNTTATANAVINMSGAVTGSGGLNMNAGSIRISGLNTFSGGVTLNAGLLDVIVQGAATALGSGTFTINGGLLKNGSSGANTLTNNVVIDGDFAFSGTSGTNRNMTFSTGGVNLGAAAGTTRTITTNAAVLEFGGVVSNGSTANTLIKTGTGTLSLSGKTNTVDRIQVDQGTLSSASTLVSTDTPFGDGVSLDAGTIALTGNNNSNLGTAITLIGDGTLTPTTFSGRSSTFSGVIGESGGSRKLTIAFGSIGGNVTAALDNTNTYTGGTDFNAGAGANIATLALGQVNALGGGAAGTGGVLRFTTATSGRESRIELRADQRIAGLQNVNTATQSVRGNSTSTFRTLTINNASGGAGDGSVFSAVIGDGTVGSTVGNGLNIVKEGTGTQTFSGINTYSGTTTINGGRLVINGALQGLGAVNVGALGTLGGAGSIAGATTISGTHAPGNSAGIQTFAGDLAYTSTGNLSWELTANNATSRGVAFDGVDVGGNLDIASGAGLSLVFNSAGSTVDFSDSFWASDRSWLVVDVAGTTTGSFSLTAITQDSLAQNASTFGSFSLSGVDNDVVLSWTAAAIPEPSSWAAILGFAAIGTAATRRRR